MIHEFRFSNFYSFSDEAVVSFLLKPSEAKDNLSFKSPAGENLSKLGVILGANASGKTNALKALGFIDWLVCGSFALEPDAALPVEPHFFYKDQPTSLSILFEMEKEIYRYEMTLTKERVLKEYLYRKTSSSFSYVFMRDYDESKDCYTFKIKTKEFGLRKPEAEKTRHNVSLIAWANQFDVLLANQIIDYFSRHWGNITQVGREDYVAQMLFKVAKYYQDNPEIQKWAWQLLRDWDLSLHDIEIEHVKRLISGEEKELDVPWGVHVSGDKKVRLPFIGESSGTQKAFVLLGRILTVLEYGGMAIIDELEADLHPMMLEPLIDLFANPETNPHGGQLICTCHAPTILNLVNKNQVLLVEKNDLSSEVWRLDEVEGVRTDDNLLAKYYAGAYGAIPQL